MKKYTTLSTDCTTLITEVMAYLNANSDVEDSEHQLNAFHIIDPSELSGTSINSTFSGLTSTGVIHCTVNGSAMFNHSWDNPCIFIPLADCENAVVKIFDVAENATLSLPIRSYAGEDCTLVDTIPLTSPIVMDKFTTFTIQNNDTSKLADVLMVWFDNDLSSYLAE